VSILPGIAVWFLAEPAVGVPTALLFSTTGVVLLQHAINLFNDAKDWQLGADQEKHDSWVRVHSGSPHVANIHGLLSLLGGSALGILSLLLFDRLWVIFYAFPFVVLGLFYNFGRRPLSYTSAGEWVTGICYGPGVFGSLWFVAGQPVNVTAIAGMLAFAALSMSLLFSHQPPQIETDRAAGKNSFAVRYGSKRTYQASAALFTAALVFLGIAWLEEKGVVLAIIFTGVAVFAAWRIIKLKANPKQILTHASFVFLTVFLVSLLSRWLSTFPYGTSIQ